MKPIVYYDDNPSEMYFQAITDLVNRGEEVFPKGKRIKELRPVIFGYKNPLKRVTFLKGRVINPFFQLAEAYWIATGGSDVGSLTDYNKSIAQFSDDGKYFNAPYGERLRHWGKNDARGVQGINLDQLVDVYKKLLSDPDTRQAVAFIGNPEFDNSEYTLNKGKDIACNLNIKFKIRQGKLDINVDNRSNDLHWGVFGANLCQFSTIQELMASWLEVGVGEYFQSTDSLHIYMDDFGAKITDKVLDAYKGYYTEGKKIEEFYFENEPRFSCSLEEFKAMQEIFNKVINPLLTTDEIYERSATFQSMLDLISSVTTDEYLRLTFYAMAVKQAHNRDKVSMILEGLDRMPMCGWKISCLRWLYARHGNASSFRDICNELPTKSMRDYVMRRDM